MLRHDFLERIIEQLGETIARVARAKSEGRQDEAMHLVHAAYSGLFGLYIGLIRSLDAQTLLELVQDEREAALVGRLMLCEAETLVASGRSGPGRRVAQRALELIAHAGRTKALGQETADDVRALAALVDVESLAGDHRAVLRRLLDGEHEPSSS